MRKKESENETDDERERENEKGRALEIMKSVLRKTESEGVS